MTETSDAQHRSAMAPEAIADYLRERIETGLVDASVAYGQVTVALTPQALPEAARRCKEDPRLDCDFFDFLAGVDEREDGFAVVVRLYSLRHRHGVLLRALADGGREDPRVPTLTGLYRGANWHEREAYDMFGITFEGHPGLLPRILTVENFEGFPLRKDFLLTTREAKPWPGSKEPEERKAPEESGDADAGGGEAAGADTDRAAAAKQKAERARQKAAALRAQKAGERQAGQTPEGAAEIAGDQVAADAAAGAVGGDTAAGASQDEAGSEQPVTDTEAEAERGEGGPPTAGAAPGVEAEGRHGGAVEQEAERPAADTPGLAPPAEHDERDDDPDGSDERDE